MKRLTILGALIVLTSSIFAQPSDNLIVVNRVEVKMDKKLEWEKAMTAFVKNHYPNMKFRVWEVITGNSTGKYVIIMGPTSYKAIDMPNASPKGEAAMRADLQALRALCNAQSVNHWRVVNGLTDDNPDRKLKYQIASYSEIEMGTWGAVSDFQKKLREARKKAGSMDDIGILRPSHSGAGNAYLYIRWIENLEELDESNGFGEVAEAYDDMFGNNSWYKDWNEYMDNVKSNHRELRILRSDLSSLK